MSINTHDSELDLPSIQATKESYKTAHGDVLDLLNQAELLAIELSWNDTYKALVEENHQDTITKYKKAFDKTAGMVLNLDWFQLEGPETWMSISATEDRLPSTTTADESMIDESSTAKAKTSDDMDIDSAGVDSTTAAEALDEMKIDDTADTTAAKPKTYPIVGGKVRGKVRKPWKELTPQQKLRELSGDGDDDEDELTWVQCDECEKFRKLPANLDPEDLPDEWHCNMNTWDVSLARCDVPEEAGAPEEELEEEEEDLPESPTLWNIMSADQQSRTHKLHEVITKNLVKVVATEEDMKGGKYYKPRPRSINIGQGGVKCAHCHWRSYTTCDIAKAKKSTKPLASANIAVRYSRLHLEKCKSAPKDVKKWLKKWKDDDGSKAKKFNKKHGSLDIDEYADLFGLKGYVPLKLDFEKMSEEARAKLKDISMPASDHVPVHKYIMTDDAKPFRKLLQALVTRNELSTYDSRRKKYGVSWFKKAFKECGEGTVLNFYPPFTKKLEKWPHNEVYSKVCIYFCKWVQRACSECNTKKTDKRFGHGGYDGNHVLDDYLSPGQKRTKNFGMNSGFQKSIPIWLPEQMLVFEACCFCHNRSTSNKTDEEEIKAAKAAPKTCSKGYPSFESFRLQSVAMVFDSKRGQLFLTSLHNINQERTKYDESSTIPNLIYDEDNKPVPIKLKDLLHLTKTDKRQYSKLVHKLLKNGTKNMCGGCARCKTGKGVDSMNLTARYKHGFEFHHIDDPTKSFDPSKYANLEDAIEELKKCIVLCRSCHFYITNVPSERRKFDKWIKDNKIYYYG